MPQQQRILCIPSTPLSSVQIGRGPQPPQLPPRQERVLQPRRHPLNQLGSSGTRRALELHQRRHIPTIDRTRRRLRAPVRAPVQRHRPRS